MKSVTYAAPETVQEAIALMAGHGGAARLLAGGTDLVTQMKEGRRSYDVLVDLKRIPALHRFSFSPESGLVVGAAVSCVRLQESPEVGYHYPILKTVCSLIGSYQIQNRATLGGNLCNAAPSADGVPALIALGATAVIAGPEGERVLDVESVCVAPGRTCLGPAEVLVELHIPFPAPQSGAAYERFIPRGEMDIAVAGVASALTLGADGKITAARMALASVAPTPLRVPAAEAVLIGKEPSEELFAEAGRVAAAACSPITDVRGSAEYRRHLVGVLARRTLADALAQARG